MKGKLLFVCIAALLLGNGAYAAGRYQRAQDGETLVWSSYPKSGYEATWTGNRDANGYATGYGTLRWYRVKREIMMGSIIPTVTRTFIVRYSGKMARGKFDGLVESPNGKGEIFHAKFVDGDVADDWVAGPAPSPARKRNEPAHEAALVQAPAEVPQRTPDQPANQDDHEGAVVETPTQNRDSLRSLTAPPSALRVGIVGETSRQTSTPPPNPGDGADDAKTVATLDTQYQAAVKANDAATIDRILTDDFVLVTGGGRAVTKADLIKQAREKQTTYEHQEEEEGTQKVRVWGDTAVVTARLWIKGTGQGTSLDDRLWFSDTYVRTPEGWRYVFGQASIPLPK